MALLLAAASACGFSPSVTQYVPLSSLHDSSRTCNPIMARKPKPSSTKKAPVIRSKDKQGREINGFVSEQGSVAQIFTWTIALGIYALMFYGIITKAGAR